MTDVQITDCSGAASDVGDESEGGYILAMTALLLIPLMIFAAFAVDVGGWYAQAGRTQRASDAAALAAVVWMPDLPKATTAAIEVAALNGFVDGVNADVIVERVGDQQVKVRIVSEGEVYFGAPVMDSIEIERYAVAEYILPVPMGNPTSTLGSGNLEATSDGIWLAINGVCQARAQGDPFSVRRVAPAGQWSGCVWTGNTANRTYTHSENLNYNEEGYTYVVDVPEGAGAVNVQIYEPGLCPGTASDGSNASNVWGGPRLNARLYAADDTPLSDQDNLEAAPVATIDFGFQDCNNGVSGDDHWYQIAQIPAGEEGRWFLRVRGINSELYGDNNDRRFGINTYALRAERVSSPSTCSSLTNSVCPQIFAKDWLSVYRPGALGSGSALFYLADINQVHAGKTVEVQLFDAGEGMDNIQLIAPNGQAVDFDWQYYTCGMLSTDCPNGALTSADNCSGTPCLFTRDPNNLSTNRFQDKSARILIELDASYDCFGATDCWWKLRYQPVSGGSPTDRTTWGVRVIGDPIRLTE